MREEPEPKVGASGIPTPFDSCVGLFVGTIERAAEDEYDIIDRGDVSDLRRMDPGLPCPGFWRIAARSQDVVVPATERRWAFAAKCMAIMAPLHHSAGARPGLVLRDQGFSGSADLRISRVLKSEGDSFERYVEGAVRFLAARGAPVDWFRFARLLVHRSDRARNDLARDFYSIPKTK